MPEVIDRFGLTKRNLRTIRNILQQFHQVREVYIFGSRAMGTFKPGSDLDLAVMNDIDHKSVIELHAAFEESDLPFRVDVLAYWSVTNPDIKSHIDRVGIPLTLTD